MRQIGFVKQIKSAWFVVASYFLVGGSLHAANSVLIAEEDFEGGMSCRLHSVGTFPVAPGIKGGMGVGGSSAYGFGRSSATGSAFDSYVNDLVFTFTKKHVITKVEFWEIERYGNWGSEGFLIADGGRITSTGYDFGREPVNDYTADSSFRKHEFSMNVVSSELIFRCWDITDRSELFIDNIKIYGYVSEVAIYFDSNGGKGNLTTDVVVYGSVHRLSKNAYIKNGYVFHGWATSLERATAGIVDYTDGQEIMVASDMTLYAVWAPIQTVIHFKANGGVFKGKDGNVTQYDQYFTYGEAQRLFTDELTPLKPDGNGNQFLGWVRGTPNVYSDSDIIDGRKEETFYTYDGTETTYFAVWTTTVTVSFYNDTDVDSGRRILSPNSFGNHLSWSVDDDVRRFKNGESVQVLPGQRIIRLYVDDEYHWIAGRFDLGSYESSFHRAYDYLELNIGNDFRDVLVYGSTPREYGHHIYVKVEPDISQPETHGDVVFFYSASVREELRGLINAQRGNVPAFDISKVRISIGKTAVNQSGNVVEDSAHGLTGLELHKYYCLPTGLYYLKDVVYDADASSGDPYWGAVLDSTFENLLFEVKDSRFTERTIDFDVFGGRAAVRVVFDPQGGECAKSEMWLLYHGTPYSNSGWISIDKKTAESLPTPEKGEDFKFLGWFTERSGGLELKSGATISGDKVHWILPFEHTIYAYAQWTDMKDYWLLLYPKLAALSGGDIVTAAKMTAANGCRTVGECYALGINPEDPNDDLKIADFKMEGGKPVITLNHTEDGSGNSLLPRVKTLGKADLSDATEEWRVVPEEGDQTMRFFKIDVEMP